MSKYTKIYKILSNNMHKTTIVWFSTFIYKQFVGSISKDNWSGGNKFNVKITDTNNLKEYEFKVKPHWYVNEDYDKAIELAKEYIDKYL